MIRKIQWVWNYLTIKYLRLMHMWITGKCISCYVKDHNSRKCLFILHLLLLQSKLIRVLLIHIGTNSTEEEQRPTISVKRMKMRRSHHFVIDVLLKLSQFLFQELWSFVSSTQLVFCVGAEEDVWTVKLPLRYWEPLDNIIYACDKHH